MQLRVLLLGWRRKGVSYGQSGRVGVVHGAGWATALVCSPAPPIPPASTAISAGRCAVVCSGAKSGPSDWPGPGSNHFRQTGFVLAQVISLPAFCSLGSVVAPAGTSLRELRPVVKD